MLHIATKGGFGRSISMLLAEGADIEAKTKNGSTPLIIASSTGNLKAVQLFIKAKAELNSTDNSGNTALINAAANGHLEIVKELLKAGAEIDLFNKDGYTALSSAIFNKHHDVVDYLRAKRKEAGITSPADNLPTRLLSGDLPYSVETADKGLTKINAFDPNVTVKAGALYKKTARQQKIILISGAVVGLVGAAAAIGVTLGGAVIPIIGLGSALAIGVVASSSGFIFSMRYPDFKKELRKLDGKERLSWYQAKQQAEGTDYAKLKTPKRLVAAFTLDDSCSKLHKDALAKAFEELYKIPANRPIMDIAARLILDKKLPLLLQATSGSNLTALGRAGAAGDASHDRVLRLAINLQKPERLKGALIHELTHIVAFELIGNNAKPYKKGEKEEYKKAVKHSIPREVSALTEQEQAVVTEMLNPDCHEVYTKNNVDNAWKVERIVRIPQLFSTNDKHGQVLNKFYPEELKYHQKFLDRCHKYLGESPKKYDHFGPKDSAPLPEVVTLETLAQSILWRAQYSALESLRINLRDKDTLITAKKEITKLLEDNGLDNQKAQLLFEQGGGRKKLERLCDQCALHCVKNYESYKEKDPNSKLGRKITMYRYTPDNKSIDKYCYMPDSKPIDKLEKCVQTFVAKHMPEEQSLSSISQEKSKSDSSTHSSKFQKETSKTFVERSQSSSEKERDSSIS